MCAVMEDWQTAPIDEKLRVVLGLLQKLTLDPEEVSSDDVRTIRSMGVGDKAIEEAIYICFIFNVMDRLADAFGFDIPTDQQLKKGARLLFQRGYKGLSLMG